MSVATKMPLKGKVRKLDPGKDKPGFLARDERLAAGKTLRDKVPRASHAGWKPPAKPMKAIASGKAFGVRPPVRIFARPPLVEISASAAWIFVTGTWGLGCWRGGYLPSRCIASAALIPVDTWRSGWVP